MSISKHKNMPENAKEYVKEFLDERHEERAAIMEFEGGLTRDQAEAYIIENYPDAKYKIKQIKQEIR
jgi:hypothetical protein